MVLHSQYSDKEIPHAVIGRVMADFCLGEEGKLGGGGVRAGTITRDGQMCRQHCQRPRNSAGWRRDDRAIATLQRYDGMTEDTSRKRVSAIPKDVERAVKAVMVGWFALLAADAERSPDAIAEAAADLTDAADNLAEAADSVGEEAELLAGTKAQLNGRE